MSLEFRHLTENKHRKETRQRSSRTLSSESETFILNYASTIHLIVSNAQINFKQTGRYST